LGGIEGLAYGLKTNLEDGLSPDEENVVMGRLSRSSTPKGKERENTPISPTASVGRAETTLAEFNIARRLSTFLPHQEERQPFGDRRRIFGTNAIPPRQPKGILRLMWDALHDKILVDTPKI
jgi:P-type Ca2+ transporter type 2C